ncbi:NAD-binding protein [Actinoplanes bogorensis]|uniref:NAD-binding protein n=1 Tax=Paractinoplanes bogorensis TaxID=1610840 RepID=A0ABS5YYK5_9ACTN|nr:NAD-binding protein [Actinoplanes bogorensis]MBU2668401.1 NAD-binding protein [Actinoplanes bogorensis]
MEGSCAGWRGHIIVCGLDDVGLRTVEQLHLAGVRIVVVEDDADARLVRVVRGWGVPVVVGSPRLVETLGEAGLPGAVAVICVLGDDLHTIEAALLTRENRPDIRIVVQLRNAAVGRALSALSISVLDVAGLSTPSLVEACLRTGTHELDLDGTRFVAAQTVADFTGPLRSRYGALAPLAVTSADGLEIEVCPGRDHVVRPGDVVTLLGTAPELEDAGLNSDTTVAASARPNWLRRKLHVAQTVLTAVDRRLAYALGALFFLLVTAMVVLRLGYREPDGTRMTLLDAGYFAVETIGTVGFGDFYFRDQPSWLRGFAIALMILGVLLATSFYALLTNTLVSIRLQEAMGRRRLTQLTGHVVVAGLGSVGVRVVERLHGAGLDVVVIEHDESCRYADQVRDLGIPVIFADATLPRTLDRVQLAEARAVAVLTSDDLVNLETGLAIRDQLGERASDVPVVLRLFDRTLAATVERNFNLGLARSTAALAAPWFVGAALGLDVIATFYVSSQLMLVGRLTVAPGGGLDGLAMQDLSARTRVVAISRAEGELEHPPRRNTRFSAGDKAYLIGPYEELLQVLRRDDRTQPLGHPLRRRVADPRPHG